MKNDKEHFELVREKLVKMNPTFDPPVVYEGDKVPPGFFFEPAITDAEAAVHYRAAIVAVENDKKKPPTLPSQDEQEEIKAAVERNVKEVISQIRTDGAQALNGYTRPEKQLPHDPVNHPRHYTNHPSGVECIDITRHMNFNLGNAVKYIWRNGMKKTDTPIQDLKKALWYLQDEINKREKEGR